MSFFSFLLRGIIGGLFLSFFYCYCYIVIVIVIKEKKERKEKNKSLYTREDVVKKRREILMFLQMRIRDKGEKNK